MSNLKVLVIGAGIGGSVAAYWIGKTGAQVTVIDKSPQLRLVGQGIDIRGKSVEVIKRMGCLEAIRAKTTKEAGLSFVNNQGERIATFEVGADGNESFTADIEIMRKDLVEILCEKAASIPSVTFKYGTEFISLTELESDPAAGSGGGGVQVEFKNGSSAKYDLVIGADGLGSATRKAILTPEEYQNSFKSLDAVVAYFSIPAVKHDSPYSRWFTHTGRRSILLRPVNPTTSSAYLNIIHETPRLKAAYKSNDVKVQKKLITELFHDVPFVEIPRVLDAMAQETDFYFARVAQVKVPTGQWSRSKGGRITLVGDAGYCPTPFTGMGTSLAILGAYVLASEVAVESERSDKGKVDVGRALERYGRRFETYVEKAQSIPLRGYMPKLINPETWVGVLVVQWLVWFFDQLGLMALLGSLAIPAKDDFELVDFPY